MSTAAAFTYDDGFFPFFPVEVTTAEIDAWAATAFSGGYTPSADAVSGLLKLSKEALARLLWNLETLEVTMEDSAASGVATGRVSATVNATSATAPNARPAWLYVTDVKVERTTGNPVFEFFAIATGDFLSRLFLNTDDGLYWLFFGFAAQVSEGGVMSTKTNPIGGSSPLEVDFFGQTQTLYGAADVTLSIAESYFTY